MIHGPMTPAPTAYRQAATLGAVTGMRSMLPFALLAIATRRNEGTGFTFGTLRPLSLLRSRGVLAATSLLAAGEVVGDKLPFVPSRLSAGPFAGRIVFGGAIGAAVCHDAGLSTLGGAAIGAAAAAGSTAAMTLARRAADRATPVPDAVWGIVEDVIAGGLGITALRIFPLT